MRIFGSLGRVVLQLILAAAIVACGSDNGGGEAPAAHPPSIANLAYAPATAMQVANGSATITGTVTFSDAGGDIAAFRMTSSAGADLTVATPQLNGIKSGTGAAAFVVSVSQVGKYTFEIWVADSQGNASNRLSGTFEVLPAVEPDHPPSIANLRYSPVSAYQVAGGTATITGTIDFADTGGDVAALRMVSSAGADLTVPTPGLSGTKSGTASGALAVSVSQVGKYTFEIWAIDSKGKDSNRLTGTFEVLPVPPPPDHPPTIANLRYSPSSVSQVPNGTTAITGTIEFADAGGDVASLRLVSSGGGDVTVALPGLSGIKNGNATAVFVVPISQVGKFTFELWAVDSQGKASNRLPGTFEVLPPDTWTKLSVSPPNTLFGIGHNGSQYVAVGRAGTIMTSPDLQSWTIRNSGITHTLRSVAFSASRIVAVGDDESGLGEAVVISSTDGATWSVHYRAGPSLLSKVIWTGTQFVAVGQERAAANATPYMLVLTSPDGVTWTQRAKKAIVLEPEFIPQGRQVTSVASSGSLLAVTAIEAETWEPVVWISANADAWTRVGLPDAVWATAPVDIIWGNGRFVAVSAVPSWDGDAPAFRSADGINWQSDTVTANLPTMNAVTAGAGEYLAIGSSYRQTSSDGLQWTAYPMTGSTCGNGVVWDGKRYVSVGDSICRSP